MKKKLKVKSFKNFNKRILLLKTKLLNFLKNQNKKFLDMALQQKEILY